jgi:hypothetical protein
MTRLFSIFVKQRNLAVYIYTRRRKLSLELLIGDFAMGFVGSPTGPRKSGIVRKLGAGYFGISKVALETEIEVYRDEEFRGIVDPVYEDGGGRHYLIFRAPKGNTQRFYLEENGYHIEGDLLIEKERKSD